MSERVGVQLHGGPFDRAIIFPPSGAIEAGIEYRGRIALYEIKGRWGSFVGWRSSAWVDDDGGPS